MGFPRQGGCTEIERFHGPDSEKFEMPRDFSPFDERQIPQLIDDDQIVMQQFLGQAAAAAGGIFLLELIDQIEQVIEPSPGPGADDRRGDADAQMGFARAGSADEDCVALGVEESTGREFPHLALIDRGVGEHEAVEVLEHRELGGGDPVADRSGLPVCVPDTGRDVDCLGGEGGGPEFPDAMGPFDRVGPDDFNLDRDHDGLACEPPPDRDE